MSLSKAATVVIEALGNGFVLCVPHDGSGPSLKPRFTDGSGFSCDQAPVDELISARLITKLTKHGANQRIGWRTANLNGLIADWWVLTQ